MKAWVKAGVRSGELIIQADTPHPAMKQGHIEIAVKATSINPVDNKLLHKPSPSENSGSIIPHCDVAGVVTRLGDSVIDFNVGDRVFGCAGGIGALAGALCEFMVADAKLVAPMPISLGFAEAAALPLVSITAWEGLAEKARTASDENILILGATGGVGHLAVQLAKSRGARVFAAVSSSQKASIAARLGADETILYNEETVDQYKMRLGLKDGFDVVFDTAGGSSVAAAIDAARNYGKLVLVNDPSGLELQSAYRKSLSIHFIMMLLPMLTGVGRERHGLILREIADLVDKGHIRPLLAKRRFSFAQANEAHAYFESGKACGKIVLENV